MLQNCELQISLQETEALLKGLQGNIVIWQKKIHHCFASILSYLCCKDYICTQAFLCQKQGADLLAVL